MRPWLPSRAYTFLALALIAALQFSCVGPSSPSSASNSATASSPAPSNSSPSPAQEDQTLQRAALEALGGREGAVLLMDPKTGRLRAIVNPRLAFEQAFPPGSTIKSFTALMALRAGLIDADTRARCTGTLRRDDFQITCSHPRSKSPFSVSQALAYSCNVFFARLSEKLSPASFRSTLASFGFGVRTGVNAEEAAGSISAGEWKVKDGVGEGGALLVTPLQLLTAYSALFNGGRLFRPQIGDAAKVSADERARLPIDELQRAILVNGCRGAVDYGTAADSKLKTLPFFVFGKTGTAAASNEFRRYGWFIGFSSDHDSASREPPPPGSLRLAVLVFLRRGHGWEAAAIAGKVLESARATSAASEIDPGPLNPQSETASGSLIRKASFKQSTSRAIVIPRSIRVRVLRENRTLTLGLEEYLLGVLAVEASVEDHPEALKAQAVISRTYALKNLGRHASEGFDLCSNTHCQQYVSDRRGPIREAVRAAVSETAGEVLVDQHERLVDAYYHASCGGMTANIESLWGQPAPSYLRGVRDDYCLEGPHSKWTDRIPREKLVHALRSDPRSNVGRFLEDIIVGKRDATGRAQTIILEGERRREISGWEFKLIVGRTLGWNLIKSTRFEITRRGSVFVFRGRGFGHGLGLCQEGAHVMARRGLSYKQILDFYFPHTSTARASTEARASSPGRFSGGEGNQISMQARLRPVSTIQSSGPSLASEHFKVTYPPAVRRTEIESVLRILEAARRGMSATLRMASLHLTEHAVEVVFHATTGDFVSATGLPWFAAGATRGLRIQLQPISLLSRRRILESTLRHEYAHAVIDEMGGESCPRWLVEGLVIRFAGEGPALVRDSHPGQFAQDDLERMITRPTSAAEMKTAYAAAYKEIVSRIERDGEARVWRDLASCSKVGGLQDGSVSSRTAKG